MTKIFIDGSAGTTGLRIRERLSTRTDLELLTLTEERRKDPEARREAMEQADIVFLCLPDDAAQEAVSLLGNSDTAVIDTSTAHRTKDDWAYGFPEIGYRERIAASRRVANPGCHASGAIALLAPLMRNHVLSPDAELSCFSLTGYSGGGKKMIAEYEMADRSPLLDAPRLYGVGQQHKHLPEIVKVCGLQTSPIFCPIVAPYYAGMEVMIPIHASQVRATPDEIREIYRSWYSGGMVHFADTKETFLSAAEMTGRDTMEITVTGNEERIVLISRFDNLGKGASGAAIQNMNLILGLDEKTGLVE